MRKWITLLLIVCLLLFTNTAMATGGGHKHKEHKSPPSESKVCEQITPNALKDLKKAKNHKARAAIQKQIQKYEKKCRDHNNPSTDEQLVSADKVALQIGFHGNDNSQYVTGALVLPSSGGMGSTITWSSNKAYVISHNGASIVRPVSNDEVVIMTATITRNQAITTKSFTLIVKAIPNTLTDTQKVAADKAALAIQFSGSDHLGSVTKALASLPVKGVNGSSITWVSGNPTVISNDGKSVIRPVAGAGDIIVVMIAIITNNSSSDNKVFSLNVKQQLTNSQKVAADKASLNIDFGGSDTLDRVTRPFDKLPAIGDNGSTIVWISSSPSIVSNDGKHVVRPQINSTDVYVVMTALISDNGVVDSKTFTLIVKKEFTSVEKLAADKADLAIIFSESETAANMTQSISLPTGGYYGSHVVWVSNSPTIVSNSGALFSRPAHGAGDMTITLTAYMSNNGIADSKTFQVVVKQL